MKKIVVIGGGTGTFVALSGLKEYPVSLSAIVTMMDSGGSTGRLRDQLGVLPPGDIRQVLVALSESDEIWRKLFTFRFENGELRGHNFGNLFLSALEKITGSFKKSIDYAGRLLQSKGEVIPVTFKQVELCVELEDGRIIEGETHIDEPIEDERLRIKRAFLKPAALVNKDATDSIMSSDLVLIGPGDLYTSLLVNLLVKDVARSIKKTKAKIVYVLNLMTKFGQTTDYTAKDHIRDIEKYLGKGVLDYIIVNTSKPDEKELAWYKEYKEFPVKDDLKEENGYKVVRRKLLSETKIKKSPQDDLKRSFIRHDPRKLAKVVMSLL
jgi:uncharacterized cofD-like protein